MLLPIVIPDPCLSEKLDPKDFDVASFVLSPGSDLEAVKPFAMLERRREREMSFNPSKAPWRRNRGPMGKA